MKRTGTAVVLAAVLFMSSTGAVFAQSFNDVSQNFWAESEISYLSNQGIISGYGDGSFHPNEQVKRSQAAAMIVEALDLETGSRPNPGFSDITSDFHAYAEAAAVKDEGIITGSDGAFLPNDALTRGQMAAVLNRSFSFSDGEGSNYFRDVEEGDVFFHDIQAIAQADITTGYQDGTYGPNEDVTRAQFSVFLARALEPEQFVQPDKTTYVNERFDYNVTYPDDWNAGREADNGDGKVLHDADGSTIRAYGTHHLDSTAPDLSTYQDVTLQNGENAHYKTTRANGVITFDLVQIENGTEYHVSGEVTEGFYTGNGNEIRDTIYSLKTNNE
ncbi:S-layer homology domain-containing protein [Salibacterium halotolerans]|uniref:S-layer homology domain-containing protein n=1 Tax=Salibacterium halotolerans TaxID=1884432 RepID=A0A1I5TFF4_9BACI|nr:S-layer homology domain-containing protein [Salibacterium halotolerans]SFP81792.1 S-layer homology domain-containing protein [Salibacterium halotolerans]